MQNMIRGLKQFSYNPSCLIMTYKQNEFRLCYLDENQEQDDGEGTDNEDSKVATKNWCFREKCDNEFVIFRKYFKAIKKNRKILEIIEEVNRPVKKCKLFPNVNTAFYENPGVNNVPPLLPSLNHLICGASKSVTMRDNLEKGRLMHATACIKLGEVVIREKATVLSNKPTCACIGNYEYSIYRCHHCAQATNKFYTCPDCDICIFCSRKCLLEALNEYHTYECYGLQRHFWDRSDDYSYLAMRMSFYGAHKKFDKNPKIKASTNYERYGNEENNYPAMFSLVTHFDKISLREWDKILYNISRTIVYLIEKSSFFSMLHNSYPGKTLYTLILQIGGLMVKHYLQALHNSVIVDMPNPGTNSILNIIQYRTRGIFPTVALLNHSCEPNATLIVYNDYLIVKTICDVKKGDELTIAYCEIFPLMELNQRRLISESIFHFTCKCHRCLLQSLYPDNCFSCNVCNVGRSVGLIKNDRMKIHCVDCEQSNSFKYISECLTEIERRTHRFETTHDLKHLENAAQFSELVYHKDSVKLFNVFMDLTNEFVASEGYPMKILEYGFKALRIMESQFAPAYFPLLSVQLEIYIHFYKNSTVGDLQKSKCDPELLSELQRRLPCIRENLKHYVHESKVNYLLEIEKRVKTVLYPAS